MEPKEKKAFEPTGLVPRSIVRTFERFRQQLLPGSETAAIREYRISRYQVLVSARCLFILLTIPIATNWLVSNWLLSPIIEHFWNTQQNEIFLNSYQEERAFAELEFFSEKLFFESLLNNIGGNDDSIWTKSIESALKNSSEVVDNTRESDLYLHPSDSPTNVTPRGIASASYASFPKRGSPVNAFLTNDLPKSKRSSQDGRIQFSCEEPVLVFTPQLPSFSATQALRSPSPQLRQPLYPYGLLSIDFLSNHGQSLAQPMNLLTSSIIPKGGCGERGTNNPLVAKVNFTPTESEAEKLGVNNFQLRKPSLTVPFREMSMNGTISPLKGKEVNPLAFPERELLKTRAAYHVLIPPIVPLSINITSPDCVMPLFSTFPQFITPMSVTFSGSPLSLAVPIDFLPLRGTNSIFRGTSMIANDTMKANDTLSQQLTKSVENYSIEFANDSSLKIKERVQEKILELAVYYNQQTILSITNVVGDLVSVFTLGCLFIWMRPEISILKSFLIEAIYSLSDTTKSFLLILLTDLLVGFHSPRGWETALELLLKHFGLPENQDFVFLFVATFPVLLDTVFKYWIFRHLNKISPSTVATYHSMIE